MATVSHCLIETAIHKHLFTFTKHYMKKTVGIFIAASLLLSGATAFAESSSSSDDQINTLITQVHQGMKGDQVRKLQSMLSLDSTVYPEKYVTGYFGKLTQQAIKRWENKHRGRNASSTPTVIGSKNPCATSTTNTVVSSLRVREHGEREDDRGGRESREGGERERGDDKKVTTLPCVATGSTTAIVTPPVVTPNPTPAPTPTPVTPPAGFTLAQIASHNNATSCYSAISGSVYNLTPFINSHPGGSGTILSLCGRDGTTSFMNQHSGQARPQSALSALRIGTLN